MLLYKMLRNYTVSVVLSFLGALPRDSTSPWAWFCYSRSRPDPSLRLPARSRSSCRWRPSIGPSNARLPLTREQDACIESFHRIGPARRGRAAPRPRRAPPPPQAPPACSLAARGHPPVGAACRRPHSPAAACTPHQSGAEFSGLMHRQLSAHLLV